MTAGFSEGRVGRVAVNVLSGIGARAATMIVGFLLTPVIVHAIGFTVFGVWSVLGAVVGYIGLLDFGLGGAFVRFISGYVEQGKLDRARDVLTFGMCFYATFGLVAAAPFFALTPAIVHLFKMPPSETAQAVWIFRALFVLLMSALVFGLPSTMVIALHRMDIANRNNVIAYLIYAAAVTIMLELHLGVAGLVVAGCIQLAVTAVLQYASARALFGGRIWSAPATWDRDVIRELFRFGSWTQLTSLFSVLSMDIGRFVTAALVGVTHVAYYELGGKLAYLTLSLPGNVLNALVPAAAAAHARDDQASLARMYRSGTICIVFGTVLLAGFFAGAADPLVRVWMGGPIPFVSTIVIVLAAGYSIGSVAEIGRALVRSMGLPQYETAFAVISGTVSLVAAVLLGARFGVIGVALGSTVGWIAGSTVFVAIFHRLRGVQFWPTVGAPASRLFVAGALATWSLRSALHGSAVEPLFGDRVVGTVLLGVAGCAYAALFCLLAWTLGVARFDDMHLLARLRATLSARLLASTPEPR